MIKTAKCLGALVLVAAVLAVAYATAETKGALLALCGLSTVTAVSLAAILYRHNSAGQAFLERHTQLRQTVQAGEMTRPGEDENERQAKPAPSLEQTLRGLTHDSRDALQHGQACLELLALKTRDRPELQELVADIQKSLDRLLHLYENARRHCSTNS